jgi:hypothetical protein
VIRIFENCKNYHVLINFVSCLKRLLCIMFVIDADDSQSTLDAVISLWLV